MRLRLLTNAALLALLTGACEPDRTAGVHTIPSCSWSYFGDPRSLVRDGHLITGCIRADGDAVVEDFELATGRRRVQTIVDGMEVDDHNNPSVVVFRGRLYAFSSPHSGYRYPLDRRSAMQYRVSARRWGEGGDWSTLRTVPLEEGCGLGYTYPNPVVSRGRLYLFMRGPCWEPYFTSTADGERWAAPRTLLSGPRAPTARRIRPYAKYSDAPDGSVLMTFSDGHPSSYDSSLYYVRLEEGRFFAADGRLVATVADLPLRLEQLDRIQPYSRNSGRAWPMDVAADATDAPVVVYSSSVGTTDTFRYARWDGSRWRLHDVAPAGRALAGYRNSGITLDHADPARVVLSRTIDGQNEIEARHTPDHGESWTTLQLTRDSEQFNIRPVIPRGVPHTGRLVVLYVSGSASSYRSFDTDVVMQFARRIGRGGCVVPRAGKCNGRRTVRQLAPARPPATRRPSANGWRGARPARLPRAPSASAGRRGRSPPPRRAA
jgi:BNR repeat-containing family member